MSEIQPAKKNTLDLKRADRQAILNMNATVNARNEKLDVFFTNQRELWTALLTPLFHQIGTREPKVIMEAQSESLAIRSRIQSDISKYSSELSKAYVSFNNAFGDRMEYYMTGFGVKTASSEKVKMVDRDLAEAKRKTELLEIHIDFLRESRKICDNLGFSIKNIVSIISYLEVN